MKTILDILSAYIFEPETFWPDDSYFHRRNRSKIAKARAGLKLKTKADIKSVLMPRLMERARAGAATLFVVSNGASGCHFFGSVLASSERYRLVGEVYFPPDLVDLARGLKMPAKTHALLDAVSAIAMGDAGLVSPGVIPVNVMHLRPDTPVEAIRQHLPGARMVALIRNPYDIAVSRTFRKADYRQASNPEAGDAEYARIQAGGVGRFYDMAAEIRWDAVVRYENLSREPLQVAADTLWTLQLPAEGLRHARPAIDNHNAEPRPEVPAEIGQVFHDALARTAARLHYLPPPDLRFGDTVDPRHWIPMETELLTPAVKKRVRATGELRVVASLEPFDPASPIDALGLEARTETWQMYFWTFCWLNLLPETAAGEDGLLRRLGELLDLTAGYCLDPASAPLRFWDDHATAYRSGTLLYLVHRHADHEVVRSRRPVLGTVFRKHADMLRGFIADDRWAGNNHGVFHAKALINLGLNCEYVSGPEATEAGIRHLKATLGAIIDPDLGISREQCFHYHLWSVKLLEDVEAFLIRARIDIGIDVHGLIEKMLAFGVFLMVGDETLPAIGDTGYRSGYRKTLIDRKLAKVFGADIRDVCALGIGAAAGDFTTVLGAEREFCAIRRRAGGAGADSLMVMTAWRERVSHGHYDVLSVWLTRDGRPLLIDSGGPYNYGTGKRFSYFIQPQAHNVVMIDRKPYRDGGRMVGLIEAPDRRGAVAEIADNHGVRHRRAAVMTDLGELLIVDRLEALDGQVHLHDALFHLPPGAGVGLRDDAGVQIAEIADGDAAPVRMFFAAAGDQPLSAAVRSGDEDELFEGWVTSSQSHMQAAPVLVLHNRSAALTLVSLVEGTAPVGACRVLPGDGPRLQVGYRDGTSREIPLDALLDPAGDRGA